MFCCNNTGKSPSLWTTVYLHKAAVISSFYGSLPCITVILRCLKDLFPPCYKYSTTVGLKVVQWACSVQSSFTVFVFFFTLLWTLTHFLVFWFRIKYVKLLTVKKSCFFKSSNDIFILYLSIYIYMNVLWIQIQIIFLTDAFNVLEKDIGLTILLY